MSSLEEQRTPLPECPADRRKGRVQSETQRFAAVENFCLFLLNGIRRQVNNERAKEVLSPSFVITVDLLCDQEIRRIKQVQELRKENKR